MDKIELAKPIAIAGVLCLYFFSLWLGQRLFEAAMRTTPIVNRHAPPPQRFFGSLGFGEGQGSAYLGGAHESGCAITPLNGRRVGHVVTQSVQSLRNALFGTVPHFP